MTHYLILFYCISIFVTIFYIIKRSTLIIYYDPSYSFKFNFFNWIILFRLLVLPTYLKLFILQNVIEIYFSCRYYAKGSWLHKKPYLSQIFIKVTYMGDYSKDKLSVGDLKIIVEQNFCKNLSPDAYKLIITKFEIIHSFESLSICRFNVLIKFSDLIERPLYHDYKNYVDLVFKDLSPNYVWYRHGVKSFSGEFRSLLSSLPQEELNSIYSLARNNKNNSVRYTSNCVFINKRAFDCDFIVKYH